MAEVCIAIAESINPKLLEHVGPDYTNKILELAEDLILCSSEFDEHKKQRIEYKILEIYADYANKHGKDYGINFSDVFSMVQEHNDGIFEELAWIEYKYGPQGYEDEFIEAYGEDSDNPDEIASHLIYEWTEYYYTEYMDDGLELDKFVQIVLDKYRMAYVFESCDIPYDDSEAHNIVFTIKMAKFVNNDCQNYINPEFMFCGFAGYSDYMNLHQEHAHRGQLLLGTEKKKP